MPIRILFLDQYSDLGGAQLCLLDLLPAIRECGWEAHLAVPHDGPVVKAARASCASVDFLHSEELSSGRKSGWDLLRFTGSLPEMVQAISKLASDYGVNLLYVNGPRLLPAAAWAARGHYALLFHCHHHLTGRRTAWLVRQALRWADATVVGCCRYALEPIAGQGLADRVVYNGVAECAQHASGQHAGIWRIGVIGRIAPEKGQVEFLQAARLLLQSVPNCRFAICGEALFGSAAAAAYARRVEELAQDLPVEFLGWRDDVCSVLAGLDLLVVPSVREPATTRVIMEAYSAEIPVVAFGSGGIPEILVDEMTGFLVEPHTPEALASRIREVLLGPRHRMLEVAAAGRAVWRERFTVSRYREEMISVIRDAASRCRPLADYPAEKKSG